MSGIYIHIPFCKQKCNYCDFYSSIDLNKQDEIINALCSELQQRKQWLNNTTVSTIYFGGGTPSLLSAEQVNKLINECYKHYKISSSPEITLEANPDDLTQQKIQQLANTSVNRLSIGIQSFNDEHLQLMNRRHTSKQVIGVIKSCQDVGFNNISGDLIYGLPNLTNEEWDENLSVFQTLDIQHLSAYHLTFEENTVFGFMQQKGKLSPIDEQQSIEQFNMLTQWAKNEQFIHYEISNFAKEGFKSKHNSSYWLQKKYLGVGPSAHSFNKNSRTWNTSNIKDYVAKITNKLPSFEIEELDLIDQHNEYLITRLRTREGINLEDFYSLFGKAYTDDLLSNIKPFIKAKQLTFKNNIITLNHNGILISDAILTELFVV